ncbi:MAG: hypothetical protein HQM08_09245 [Candidatus Riflebacteria bacterium]|nr:hypothetical protein [Candidatus Riflebacteria bacterium]
MKQKESSVNCLISLQPYRFRKTTVPGFTWLNFARFRKPLRGLRPTSHAKAISALSQLVLFTVILFLASPCILISAEQQGPTGNFQIWLLNNETRFLAQIARDRKLIEQFNSPIAFFPNLPVKEQGPEQILMNVHYSLHAFLNDSDDILSLTGRFKTGFLAKSLGKIHYGKWAIAGVSGPGLMYARNIVPILDSLFQENLLTALGIDKQRDGNIVERFQNSYSQMSDTEKRMLTFYLENFLALYPGSQSIQEYAKIVEGGLDKRFGKTIQGLIVVKPASSSAEASGGLEDFGNIESDNSAGSGTGNIAGNASGTATPSSSVDTAQVAAKSTEKSDGSSDSRTESSSGKVENQSAEKPSGESSAKSSEKSSEKSTEKSSGKSSQDKHKPSDKNASGIDNIFDGFVNDL